MIKYFSRNSTVEDDRMILVRTKQQVSEPEPGYGTVQVVQSRTVGDLDWRSCSADSCQCAVIESVRVDQGFRRRGYATAAVRAAVELTGPGYTWSTTAVTGIAAQAFWSSMGWPPTAHIPRYCPHMTDASVDNLDRD